MRKTLQITICLAIILMATACQRAASNDGGAKCGCHGFRTGDLIFVEDADGMGNAIQQSTGRYTHVAIAMCEDATLFVYEAVSERGVIRTKGIEWFDQWGENISGSDMPASGHIDFRRLDEAFDTARLAKELGKCLSQPYDPYFQADNGRMYCSELVCNCYYSKEGKRIFEAKPMNFKNSDGEYPEYWIRHFDSLGVAIPQGELGTNPTDIYNDKRLTTFKIE